MSNIRIVGYKKIFGFVMPDWVSESLIKNFALGFLAAAVMLLVLIIVVFPRWEVVLSKEGELLSARADLALLTKSRDGLLAMASNLTESDQAKILFAMPREYSPELVVSGLREISNDTGVSIVSYNLPSGTIFDAAASKSAVVSSGKMVEFVTFPIRVTVSGSVETLLKFITKVETSLPFGLVSDLNIQEAAKLSQLSSNKNVQLTMEIKYFISSLNKVNLSKLQPFTEEELRWVGVISGYDLPRVFVGKMANQPNPIDSVSPVSIFGF